MGSIQDAIYYTYGNSNWGDLLTAYDGKPITYDTIGNPLTYDGWTFTWEHGRELASMAKNGTTWSFTYDANGLRTKRTNGTTTYQYVYNGSKLTQMSVNGTTVYFAYHANGHPDVMIQGQNVYHYITNLRGDVMGIVSEAGQLVVSYEYDAWGNILATGGSLAPTLGAYNPLRYRGYVYDHETELYYLQSRYYNPEIGRFINADALISTGQGELGNNMFAYCGNNPVRYDDPTGYARNEELDSQFCYILYDYGLGGGGGGGAMVGGGAIIGLTILNPAIVAQVVDGISAGIDAAIQFTDNLITAAQHELEKIKESLQPEYQYWEAYRIKNIVYIGRGLTIVEASVRVSCGLDIMCANEGAARWILILNGYWNHTNAEIHGDVGYYWHYHPHRNSHVHIWYYS